MNATTATEETTTVDETTTVELEALGPSWVDYIDLGLKALLVIAAFAIYARL